MTMSNLPSHLEPGSAEWAAVHAAARLRAHQLRQAAMDDALQALGLALRRAITRLATPPGRLRLAVRRTRPGPCLSGLEA